MANKKDSALAIVKAVSNLLIWHAPSTDHKWWVQSPSEAAKLVERARRFLKQKGRAHAKR